MFQLAKKVQKNQPIISISYFELFIISAYFFLNRSWQFDFLCRHSIQYFWNSAFQIAIIIVPNQNQYNV